MVLDLIVIGVIVLAFVVSARKGLVKSVWKIAALILTIVLVTALKTPMVEYLSQTKLNDMIYDSIHERLLVRDFNKTTEIESGEEFSVPQFIIDSLTKSGEIEEYASNSITALCEKMTEWAIQIIASVGLFIIIRLFLMAAFMIADGASKLPIINQANALLGGLLGVVNILAVIYIACALVSLFAAEGEISRLINQSYIVKHFYNYNILLQLII